MSLKKRKRDWPVQVYQYGVRLPGMRTWSQPPEAVRNEGEAMRELWNALVSAFVQQYTQYQEILSHMPGVEEYEAQIGIRMQQRETARVALSAARRRLRRRVHPQLEDLQTAYARSQAVLQEAYTALRTARASARAVLRSALSAQRRTFLAEARRLARVSPAHWSNSEWVLRNFLSVVNRMFRGKGGPPRPNSGILRTLHVQHRLTRGGMPVERLFGGTQRVVHLERPPEHEPTHARPSRSRGSIRVGGELIPFEIRLHRPLPNGAFIKSVALVGRQTVSPGFRRCHDQSHRHVPARWHWSLQVAIEIPPVPPAGRGAHEPVAALEVGYRVWGEEVRVGVLVDSTGQTEALFLPATIVQQWRYRRSLQEEADRLLDATKTTLRALPVHDALPQEARVLLAHLANMRAGGLWDLLRVVESISSEHGRVLQYWADRYTRLWREARGLEQHYRAHRTTLYRTWALHLCQRYRKIVMKKLALKRIAAAEPPTVRLREAAKYRHLVALSYLQRALRHAAVKTGTELAEIIPSIQSRTCAECGTLTFGDMGELYQVCPNGHRWDQDENMGKTLLRTLTEGNATFPGQEGTTERLTQ